MSQGGKYYESLLGEANIVATAYANFGKRVQNLKTKLEDKIKDMDNQQRRSVESISPIPSPDYDAPSPEADEMELELPDDSAPAAPIAVNEPVIQQSSRQSSFEEMANPPYHRSTSEGSGDLNSRLDSMMNSIPGMVSIFMEDYMKYFHNLVLLYIPTYLVYSILFWLRLVK